MEEQCDFINNENDSRRIEIVYIQNGTTSENISVKLKQEHDDSCLATGRQFRHKLKTSKKIQQKFIYSICLFLGKFIQGWSQSVFGPSYIDIRMISGADLADGSWILTSRYVGSALGSTLQGMLYGRVNSKLLFGLAMMGNCIAFAIMPWCARLEAMIIAHILLGIAHGIYASGISADILRIWGKDGRVVLMGCQLLLSFGSALGPLAVTPHLVESGSNGSLYSSISQQFDRSVNATGLLQDERSFIYIPFSITSCMSILAGLFFFLLYIKHDRRNVHEGKKNPAASLTASKLPNKLNMFVVGMFGLVLVIFAGINETFTGFLATYCVRYFHWSKKDGALISFLFFLFDRIAQIAGIFVNKWLNTIICEVINVILICLSVLGIMTTSLYYFDILFRLFVPLIGFAKGTVLSMIFSWTNEHCLPATGKISAIYYICLMTGGALNPIILGYVMDIFDLVWFCYIFLIESVIMLTLTVVMTFITRYVISRFGPPFKKSPNAEQLATKDPHLKNRQMLNN